MKLIYNLIRAMINLRAMYDLYNITINHKIQEKKKFIEEQTERVNKYSFKMNEVASILSMYIDYTSALNGKISKLPDEILAKNTTEIKYANMILKNYYELRKPIEIVSQELKELKKEKLDFAIYKTVLSLHNKKLSMYLINTGKTYENKYLGTLKIGYKENTAAIVNWNESNKNKKALLEKNLIPYKKEDEEKALAEGREYNGVKWLVMGYDRGVPVLKWVVPDIIKEELGKKIGDFKYVPARGKYGIIQLLRDDYNSPNFNPNKYQKI